MPLELNSPSTYEVSEISQRMSKAATCAFSVISDHADAGLFPARTRVMFSVTKASGMNPKVVLFDGYTLPASRKLAPGAEQVVYTAADIVEQLGYTPCDEVNQWYNRTTNDAGVYPYPTDQTLEQIITTELASIVGAGKLIYALDFTALGSVKDIVPREFEVKGKTFLGILDALATEVGVMGFWADPSTLNINVSPATGGSTLRFYDGVLRQAQLLWLGGLPRAPRVAHPRVGQRPGHVQRDPAGQPHDRQAGKVRHGRGRLRDFRR